MRLRRFLTTEPISNPPHFKLINDIPILEIFYLEIHLIVPGNKVGIKHQQKLAVTIEQGYPEFNS
jgi:hypothetical protein